LTTPTSLEMLSTVVRRAVVSAWPLVDNLFDREQYLQPKCGGSFA
jgi:hypothetical protein